MPKFGSGWTGHKGRGSRLVPSSRFRSWNAVNGIAISKNEWRLE